jgi:hypothetical protein
MLAIGFQLSNIKQTTNSTRSLQQLLSDSTSSRRALMTDAAHLYVTHAKAQPQAGLPVPGLATVFEVVNGGMVHTVEWAALQRWIEQRRQEWKGPRGLLFSRRPTLV